jgi:hypothetical protein
MGTGLRESAEQKFYITVRKNSWKGVRIENGQKNKDKSEREKK